MVEALAQAGLDAPVDDLIDAHGEGRRRAVFHARRGTRDVLEVGFAALRAHHVVAIDRCPILAPGLDGAIEAAWAIAEALAASGRKPLDIQATATDAGLDVDVRGSGPVDGGAGGRAGARCRQAPAGAAHAPRRDRRAARGADGDHGPRARVALPPGAFLQATAAGEAALARLVAENCGGAAEKSPTCSRASGRSRCGLPSARA